MKNLKLPQLKKRSANQLVAILKNEKGTYDLNTQVDAAQVLESRAKGSGIVTVPSKLVNTLVAEYLDHAQNWENDKTPVWCVVLNEQRTTKTQRIAVDNAPVFEHILEETTKGKKAPKAEPKAEAKAPKADNKKAQKPKQEQPKEVEKEAKFAQGANYGKIYKKSGKRTKAMVTADGVEIESGATVKFAVKQAVVKGEFRHVNQNVHSPAGYAVIKVGKKVYERVLGRVWSTKANNTKILKVAAESNLV